MQGPVVRQDDEDEPVRRPARDRRLSVLAAIVVAVLTTFALRELRDVLLPIVLSMLLFYALDPLVDRIAVWVPRVVATLLVLALLVGGLGAAVYSFTDETLQLVAELPRAARELRTTLNTRVFRTGALEQMRQAAREIEKTANDAAGPSATPEVQRVQVTEPPLDVGEYVWWWSLGTAAAIGQAIVVLFLTFFLIQSNELYRHKIVHLVGPQLTSKKITVRVLASIEEQIEQFLRVQIFTSSLVGVVTWLALWAFGVNHAPVWGLAAGVMNWIPFFGPMTVTAGLIVVVWVQFSSLWMVTAAAGTALAITTVEGLLLTPVLHGRAARMNPVAVFVSLLFWSWVWGILGALLAVPMMMAVKVTCDHIDMLRPIGELLGD